MPFVMSPHMEIRFLSSNTQDFIEVGKERGDVGERLEIPEL